MGPGEPPASSSPVNISTVCLPSLKMAVVPSGPVHSEASDLSTHVVCTLDHCGQKLRLIPTSALTLLK